MKARGNTHLLELTYEKFEEIFQNDKTFGKRIQLYQNSLLRKNKKLPLDYILATKSSLDETHDSSYERGFNKRRNVLKNICFNKIIEVRYQKSIPKLGDLLKHFRDKPHIDKRFILTKVVQLFSGKAAVSQQLMDLDREDKKFDELSGYFDRMKKVFQVHNETISEIENKLVLLTKRRHDREKGDMTDEQLQKAIQEFELQKSAE